MRASVFCVRDEQVVRETDRVCPHVRCSLGSRETLRVSWTRPARRVAGSRSQTWGKRKHGKERLVLAKLENLSHTNSLPLAHKPFLLSTRGQNLHCREFIRVPPATVRRPSETFGDRACIARCRSVALLILPHVSSQHNSEFPTSTS